MERAEAEAIYGQGRDAVVEVLLALSAQNERLEAQVAKLTAKVVAQDERIASLERQLGRSSRNSSQPPSADPPSAPPRRGKDPSGRKQGAQPGHEGKGRPLLPAWAVDEIVEHWPTECGCGHVFLEADRVAVGQPARRQVEELPVMAVRVTEHQCQRVVCPGCGARQTGLLPDTAAASAFGPRLQAAVVTLSVRNRISRRDVVELCQQLFSSRISTGTVDAILARAADALTEPCEDLLGAFCLFGARKGRPERAGPGRARGRALRPQHPAPEGFACPDMPAQEDAFARDYEPGEIAEIAKKLREDAGFSRTAEPTRSAGRAGACDRARYVQCCICG